MTSVGGGAALHYIMPLHEHRPRPFPSVEPADNPAVAADVNAKELEGGEDGDEEPKLNLTYHVKPPRPVPGGFAERLEKMRAEAKMARELHIENKPAVFGSQQPRIQRYPGSKPMLEYRPPGYSDWGNGKVVGTLHHNPIWGKREEFPDDLDIAGHYKAAEPGETPKQRIYMDVKQPNKAGLWSRTLEPRMAAPAKPAAQPHIAKGVDPYDVFYKEKPWRERGTIRSQTEFRSAGFADTGGRVDIRHQTGPHMTYVRRPSTAAVAGTVPRPSQQQQQRQHGGVRSSLEVWQETMARINLQHNTRTFVEEDKAGGRFHDQERFGAIVGIEVPLATAKSKFPEAPPPTKYDCSHPSRPTIATSARRVESAMPGYRGGIFRKSTSGSHNFISSADRLKIPAWKTATSERTGLGPQSHADGLLRDSIAGRAQSARPRGKKVERPVVDQPVLTGKTRKRRSQSARAYHDAWKDSDTRAGKPTDSPGTLVSPLVTEELMRKWATILQ